MFDGDFGMPPVERLLDASIPGPIWTEADRLLALEGFRVMDTPRESDFDDIVKVAALICGVPMALISLVDSERQWFKAAVGVDAPETPRDLSFCAHAIQQKGMFTVEDATLDPRFSANPLVTGDPNLRFYAGVPLETPDGLPLGALCVLDTRTRVLNEDQNFALKALARQVMAQLELRKALADQRAAEAQRALLILELQHRVKNTLAMVQAIVSQTLRTTPDSATASAAISDRLVTLGKAHDLLTAATWKAAPLESVIHTAVSNSGLEEKRFHIAGPAVELGARAALAVALALHELNTNAMKYGALSNAVGKVDITWSIEREAGGDLLRLEWREGGGPPVTAPKKTGFGSRLIQAAVVGDMNGTSVLAYDPAGVRWTLVGSLAVMAES